MPTPSFRSKAAGTLAAGLLTLASSAPAAVVCNSGAPMPFTVPQNIDGVYVNLVTGTFQTTGPFTAGWDIDPFGTSTLSFFWPSTPANSHGTLTDGTNYRVLSAGDPIGPSGTFATSGGYTLWRATNTGKYLGIRFYNEGAAIINYGWIQLDTTGTSGHPAIIQGYCYQNDGTQILAGGTVPVELQSFDAD